MQVEKNILITPLNWGLGHATRCIPIIRSFQEKGFRVVLASDGRAMDLLKAEFPDLLVLELPTYNIYYAKRFFALKMLLQLPKIIFAILAEHFAVKRIVQARKIDLLISDNRFGCFHFRKKSIFITHQLNIIIPNFILQGIVRFLNKTWIRIFFDECWIPDSEGIPNLSGVLSHDVKMPNLRYIGLLSRMRKLNVPKRYDWIAVLSGPEPQRTYLEKMIIKQAKKSTTTFQALIIGGKSEHRAQYFVTVGIEYISFLTSETLNEALCAANLVICRSGYSTLMDLAKTGSKAILIPTPKQTEQEYLANYFMKQGIFFSMNQEDFDLEKALEKGKEYSGFSEDFIPNYDSDFLF